MEPPLRPSDLEAYLDEALPAEEMASIERRLRAEPALRDQLAAVLARRDAGVHCLGEIWRRHRISCPSRQQLGSFLLGTLAREAVQYITFHLEVIGCRYCQANLRDLKARQSESPQTTEARQRRYFQSSAGYLRRK